MNLINTIRTSFAILKWRGHLWYPSYLLHHQFSRTRAEAIEKVTDVIVVIVDHYEPSRQEGERGIKRVREWCDDYAEIAGRHRDSDGVMPQHTWFYRYDYPNFDCINILSEYTFGGLGEIEFHLHHGNDTPESFRESMQQGVEWFNTAGAMISYDAEMQKCFAYIAGNWALDNGQNDPSTSGVNTELEILSEIGCYADFTFPAFGAKSQPWKINSIYYAKDTPEPKSYNTGIDVEVGGQESPDLMIFEGPLSIDWSSNYIEYAALESYRPYFEKRIDYWRQSGIAVKGRPEWCFIKLHTHGMQSRDEFLSDKIDQMFSDLERRYKQDGMRLHYVVAREAYNMVKAAEAGETGDAGLYRDYAISQPANRRLYCTAPYALETVSDNILVMNIQNSEKAVRVDFNGFPLARIEGEHIERIELEYSVDDVRKMDVFGTGTYSVHSSAGIVEQHECISPSP